MSGQTTSCSWSSENLLAGYRGELSDLESDQLNTHLADCPACRSENDDMAFLSEAIAALPEIQPAEESFGAIRMRIQETDAPAGPPRRGRLLAFIGSGLAAAIALLFVYLLPSPPPSPLTVLAGDVTLDGNAATGEISPAKGAAIDAETIALLSVALPRAAEITLAKGARLTCLAEGEWRLDKGRALFEVSPGSGDITVRTTYGDVRVEGTMFDLDLTDEGLTVSVLRGVVSLRTGDQPVRVDSGTAVMVAKAGNPGAPIPVDADRVLRWNRAPTSTLDLSADLLRFTLANETVRPLAVKPFDPAVGVYSLRIEASDGTYEVKLQSAMLADTPAGAPGRPAVTLKPGEDYRLAIDPRRLSLSPGDYRVSVVYTPYTKDLPEDAWRGVLISPPVRLRVP